MSDYTGWTCGKCGGKVSGRYSKCEPCGIDPIADMKAKSAMPTTTAETKAEPHIAFLKEAANYFRKLDTHGEDMAFWANATNAETCERIAATLASITIERDAMREALVKCGERFREYERLHAAN